MTRWLDDDEQRAWRGYLHMQARLTARLNRQLQDDSGLSLADFAVLVELSEVAGGRTRVLALAEKLEWEKSRLSHQLNRMRARGLIDRQECPNDRRGAFVALTPQGRTTIEAAAPRHVETVREYLFDRLTPELVAALTDITDRVAARLAEDED
ncbi:MULTISPECIES: MarR family winged helix-turn-helix transcriptional regulator [Actinokineospora]|uniref:MarR family transcriptional regulator n=1 Tax=Actinokineospora fastidiosa TaxID=1816 RepID=A0A918LES9_9PSEU|nr:MULTISPECIES: MarR family transcriptional regulator [Actinokineospora]UVS80722.1 DNA-binding transcriptional repressor MarR [Actinokineospora sp. UTMC 2448]GGS36661.1 MarR family transcriptional regulator [Actinokineospora fastidiosa]